MGLYLFGKAFLREVEHPTPLDRMRIDGVVGKGVCLQKGSLDAEVIADHPVEKGQIRKRG